MTPFDAFAFYATGIIAMAAVIRVTLWATERKSDETMLEDYWRGLEEMGRRSREAIARAEADLERGE